MISILIATGAVALVSLAGIIFLGTRTEEKYVHSLVSLSIGVFLAVIFLNLIPESMELSTYASWYILAGYLFFFTLSFLLDAYHHHHGDDCHQSHAGRNAKLLLAGDAIHNFVDGITIATSFMIHPSIGFATTAGVLLHEVPQELAEFILLVRGGYSKSRALFLNALTALSVVLGGIVTYYFLSTTAALTGPLLGIAAGNLLYIATADLLPELREHKDAFWKHLGIILIGLVVTAYLFASTPHGHAEIEDDGHEDHTHTH